MTAKDHKRKARPIGPATVTVRDGEIVVVVPDVLGKNEATTGGRKNSESGARFLSTATKLYRASVLAGAGKLLMSETTKWFDVSKTGHLAGSGAWRLEVIGVWPTQNHDVGFEAPRGDADAAIPQALDALQHAGILDDDARVVEVRAWNMYRKGVRATVMRLVKVSAFDVVRGADGKLDVVDGLPERDAAIAHLLPLVPPTIEPEKKSAKPRRKKVAS